MNISDPYAGNTLPQGRVSGAALKKWLKERGSKLKPAERRAARFELTGGVAWKLEADPDHPPADVQDDEPAPTCPDETPQPGERGSENNPRDVPCQESLSRPMKPLVPKAG